MRKVLATIFLLSAMQTASAKDVVLTLNDDEQKAMWSMFDTAVKAKGMEAVPIAQYFTVKLQAAIEAANKPPAKPDEHKPAEQPKQ